MKKLNIKARLQQLIVTQFAMVALVIAGVSGIVLSAPVLADCDTSTPTLQGGTQCANPETTAQTLTGPTGVFAVVANILLFLVGAVAVIMLIIGGLRYVTSNGDQNAVTGAKNTILYAIIGIVVAFLAYAGVQFVTSSLTTGSDVPSN
ncbi:MAG: pilin [Candidatus Saccharibacteria bacterium]|nr:pilin [Candidatus Saccharibacteria bacterium]